MRTKTVKRYWCDFCNKAGLSAAAMSRHEKHCTLNPSRECRVCKMSTIADGRDSTFKSKTVAELKMLLPARETLISKEFPGSGHFCDSTGTLEAAIPLLREAAGNCPACMLAAIRQAGIPVPICEGFDFTAEMKEIWNCINNAQDRYD